VVDNTDGIMLDHSLHRGIPADTPLLAPAIARIGSLLGLQPEGGDRRPRLRRGQGRVGAGRTRREERGHPAQGQPSQAPPRARNAGGFRRLVRWRTGSEGRIAYLKRRHRLDRSLLDGLPGVQTWYGSGVLAHNTVKIATLAPTRRPTGAADKRLDESLSVRGLADRYGVHRRRVRQVLASAIPPERKVPQRVAPRRIASKSSTLDLTIPTRPHGLDDTVVKRRSGGASSARHHEAKSA
jgi:hypothetical protein